MGGFDETGALLDSILCRWHQWAKAYRHTRGFAPTAAGFSQWRCSRQWDDANGALDDAVDDTIMRQVDFDVSELAEPYRAALHVHARALTLGVFVFTSPRLPDDPDARATIIRCARGLIAVRLVASGVL